MRVFITGGSGFVGRNMIRYLKSKSIPVVALVRSDDAEKVVTQAGAESSVRGDLDNKDAIMEGMKGCDTVIHAAAYVNSQGPWSDFYNVTVLGTKRVLESAVETESIKRFVHIGSEAALCTLQPLVNIDETYPLPDKPVGNYAKSKNLSERLVREANNTPKKDSGVLETIVVRPRFIWGGDDTVLMSNFKQKITSGDFKWVNGGNHRTSTSHINNVCEGTYLAAKNGKPGGVYFIIDDGVVAFRKIVTDMMQTQNVDTSRIGNLPEWLTWSAAWMMDNVVTYFATPPLDRFAAWIITTECVLNGDKAKKELGYQPITTYEEGMKDLAQRYNSH